MTKERVSWQDAKMFVVDHERFGSLAYCGMYGHLSGTSSDDARPRQREQLIGHAYTPWQPF